MKAIKVIAVGGLLFYVFKNEMVVFATSLLLTGESVVLPDQHDWRCLREVYEQNKPDAPYMLFDWRRLSGCSSILLVYTNPGKTIGYTAILAQAKGSEKVKWIGNGDFAISNEEYELIKAKRLERGKQDISKEVEEFIILHVKHI